MDELIHRKSWFKRNWKWAVPVGGCFLIIIALVMFAGSLILGISSMVSESQAYEDAMASAQQNERLIELIGEPIETSGISSGNIQYSNGAGNADLSIPIKGPIGEATIRVIGSGKNDNWRYEIMEVTVSGNDETIDLLEDFNRLK